MAIRRYSLVVVGIFESTIGKRYPMTETFVVELDDSGENSAEGENHMVFVEIFDRFVSGYVDDHEQNILSLSHSLNPLQ